MVAPATGRGKAEIPAFTRPKRVFDAIRWDERHRTLLAQPVFAGCSRGDIRRILRSGDDVLVDADEVLLHEDGIGYWFFVLLSGSVGLTRAGRPLATLGPSSHVGDIAILGFGPQPATATALEAARLFVLGRRELLNLSATMPSLQRGLFPGIAPDGFTTKIRELREEATTAWRALPVRPPAPTAHDGTDLPPPSFRWTRPPDRRADQPFRPRSLLPVAISLPVNVSTRLGTKARVIVGAVLAAALVVAGLAFHPPVLVIRPEPATDAVAGIDIDGVAAERPTGRYLVTAVDIARPNAFGALWALATRADIVRDEGLPAGIDEATARQLGLDAFQNAQHTAVEVVAKQLRIDPARLRVRFRSEGITGPSAGLVYALALVDMLDGGEDLARGRTIAATGALANDGAVSAVGFVTVKEQVADSAHADLLLVPRGERTGRARAETIAVENLNDAIEALRRSAR